MSVLLWQTRVLVPIAAGQPFGVFVDAARTGRELAEAIRDLRETTAGSRTQYANLHHKPKRRKAVTTVTASIQR